jgi:predicted RNA-binding protein (TIGR00451 family)
MSLEAVRAIADFQFDGVGSQLFPDGCVVEISQSTGRARRVWLNGVLLATVRPGDGLLSLTMEGGRILAEIMKPPRFRVMVSSEATSMVAEGKSVFSRHVVEWDRMICPGQEVLVVGLDGRLLAVGKALLSGLEIGRMSRGVAVKVRSSVGMVFKERQSGVDES